MDAPPSYLDDEYSAELADLPTYTNSVLRSSAPASPTTLRERPVTEHVWTLTTLTKNRAWATLKLQSDAGGPDRPPIWIEGQPIKGSLQLTLDKNSGIEAVSFIVGALCVTRCVHILTDMAFPSCVFSLWALSDQPFSSITDRIPTATPVPVWTQSSLWM
jgi:hypothetical protein